MGETPLNPENLRYIDGQGAPNEDGMGVWASEVKAFLHSQTLKSLFSSEEWVFITVDSIAMPISRCPLKVFATARADDGKNRKDALEQHEVTKLLANPNPHQSDREMRYSLAVDTILGGNGFLYHAISLRQLFNMPFERVQYDFDGEGLPKSVTFYRQHQDDVFVAPQDGRVIPLGQVVHARRPNPSSAIWGLSPFIPGRKSILFNRYSSDYLLAFYLKGATPQMILELDKDASQQALVRMIRSFEAAFTGRRNQRRTLVLPKGVKATPADSKIADQQLIELIKNNRETVLNILRVPKHALGLQEAGSLGSREHELALRYFWKQTIAPTMELIEDALTRHFKAANMLRDGERVLFDTSEVDYVQEDLYGDAELSEKLKGSWTVNERRDRLFGLPAIPDGDRIADLPPLPMLPSFGPAAPADATPPEESAPVETPPVVPVTDAVTNAVPEAAPEQSLAVEEVPPAATPEPAHARVLSKYEAQLRGADEKLAAQASEQIPKMTRVSVALFARQAEVAMDVLEDYSRAHPFGQVRAPDDVPIKEFRARLAKAMAKLKDQYVEGYEKTLMATVDAGYATQVGMVFDEKAREALAAYQETDVKGQRKALKARGLYSFKSVTDTSTDRVTDLVEEGLREGKTVSEVATGIQGYMKEQARWRADMVARTETLTAFSVGSMATLERAKQAIPGMKKMWVTSADERVRAIHADRMGKVVDADEEFADGLRFPRDPGSREAGEVINCRCQALFLPPEDVADYTAEIDDLSPKPVKVD